MFRLAYRLTGNRPDAEDLTQEVFVRVFRSLSTYQPGTFEGWIHRITTNLFLDQARRKQRIRFDALSDERADRLTSASASPDAAYADRTFDDDVELALASLPPEFRAAVVLCDVEGLSYQEIADIMDAKLGTVRSRIHRGRAMLREALAHRAPAEGRRAVRRPRAARTRPHRRSRGGVAVIGGHLGNRVSDLLDGQLEREEEDRAWQHVHACHYCRDLVEREGWVKTRLAGLSLGGTPASDRLKDALMGAQAGLTPGDALLALAAKPRRGSLVAIGGGAAGAAVLGVLALGAAPANAPAIDRRVPSTNVPQPGAVTSTPLPSVVADGRPPRPLRPRLPGFVKIGR